MDVCEDEPLGRVCLEAVKVNAEGARLGGGEDLVVVVVVVVVAECAACAPSLVQSKARRTMYIRNLNGLARKEMTL